MEAMGLTRADVVAVLNRPATTTPSRGRARIARNARLAVVYDCDTVITVLWREDFVRDEAANTGDRDLVAAVD
jgi:hypothetical protein